MSLKANDTFNHKKLYKQLWKELCSIIRALDFQVITELSFHKLRDM